MIRDAPTPRDALDRQQTQRIRLEVERNRELRAENAQLREENRRLREALARVGWQGDLPT